MSKSRKKILIFLLLTFAFSSVFYYLIITAKSLQNYSIGLMWCPGVAAIITQLLFRHNLRNFGWGSGKVKYLLLSYGLPVVYGGVVYMVVWLTGLGKFIPEEMVKQITLQMKIQMHSPPLFLIIYIFIMATIGLLANGFVALGEEIGWRGLFVPELYRETSFRSTAIISGGIWALWHFPEILFANYNNFGAPVWFGLICFSLMTIGLSFVIAWLRLKSGSLWPAVILHASHNLFIQSIFNPLTGNTSITPFVIGEFGIGITVSVILTAVLFWRKRGDLPEAGAPIA